MVAKANALAFWRSSVPVRARVLAHTHRAKEQKGSCPNSSSALRPVLSLWQPCQVCYTRAEAVLSRRPFTGQSHQKMNKPVCYAATISERGFHQSWLGSFDSMQRRGAGRNLLRSDRCRCTLRLLLDPPEASRWRKVDPGVLGLVWINEEVGVAHRRASVEECGQDTLGKPIYKPRRHRNLANAVQSPPALLPVRMLAPLRETHHHSH